MTAIPVDDIFSRGNPSMLEQLQQGELLLTLSVNFDGVFSGADVQRLDEARGLATEESRFAHIRSVVEGIGVRVSNARHHQPSLPGGRRNIKF